MATGWIEIWGWHVVAALIPWIIVMAMFGVVAWTTVAPFVGAGGVVRVWQRVRQRHQLNPPPWPPFLCVIGGQEVSLRVSEVVFGVGWMPRAARRDPADGRYRLPGGTPQRPDPAGVDQQKGRTERNAGRRTLSSAHKVRIVLP